MTNSSSSILATLSIRTVYQIISGGIPAADVLRSKSQRKIN